MSAGGNAGQGDELEAEAAAREGEEDEEQQQGEVLAPGRHHSPCLVGALSLSAIPFLELGLPFCCIIRRALVSGVQAGWALNPLGLATLGMDLTLVGCKCKRQGLQVLRRRWAEGACFAHCAR